jgi:hypothetical protein
MTRETVHHPAQPAVSLIPKDRDGVIVGFASVNDNGQIELGRQTHLRSKDVALDVARRVIVVIVEANLANCPRGGDAADLGTNRINDMIHAAGKLPRNMRMNSNGNSQVGPVVGEPQRALLFGLVAPFEDTQDSCEPRFARPVNHRLRISGKRVIGQMAVGVDHVGLGLGALGFGL